MTSAASPLAAVLAYLEQAEALEQPATVTVPADVFRAFEADVGHLPGLTFNQLHEDDDLWLSLPRLGAIPPPDPPASLEPWIELTHSAHAEPTLRSEVTRSGKSGETRLALANFPGLRRVFETYLEQQWSPWAESERPRRLAIALYARLFALRQRLVTGASDEPLELVWGMGVALWKPAGARLALCHPLITQTCDIALNAETFELEIRPCDAPPVLEIDALAALKAPALDGLVAAWNEHLTALPKRPTPFEMPTTVPFLKSAVKLLDPGGDFLDAREAGRLPDAGKHLRVSDTWVLFVRGRSSAAIQRDLAAWSTRVAANPEAVQALAPLLRAREPARAGAGTPATSASHGTAHYFALPATEAQAAVADALATEPIVLVDGAPGTGKSQTIANVIGHSLAHGKRLLVTAADASTLAGLRNLLPEDLRPLVLSATRDDRSTARQFLHAAQALAARSGSAKLAELEASVAEREKRRGELAAIVDAADRRIAEIARAQRTPIASEGVAVEPGELAKRIVDSAERHEWLADPLDPETQSTPAVSDEDVATLRRARAELGADLAYLGAVLPDPAALPDEASLEALHAELLRAHRTEALNASGTVMPLIDASPQTLARAEKLRDLLDKADSLHAAVDPDPFGWADRLRIRFQAREDPLARSLVTVARSVAVEDLAQRVRMNRPVELPVGAELSADVVEAIERLTGGKLGFRMPLGKKAARASLDAITVAGQKPESAADWRRVADELEHRLKARKLLGAWNDTVGECGLEPLPDNGPRAFAPMAARADHVLKMHELVTRVEAPIRVEIPAVFAREALEGLSEYDGSMRRAAAESLVGHLDTGQLAEASRRAREVLVKLEGASGGIVDRLWSLLTTAVGRDGASTGEATLTSEWRELLTQLRRLRALAPTLATVERVTAAIEAAGATRWARDLRESPAGAAGDPLIPEDWRAAWQWRVAAMRLGTLEGHDALYQTAQRRQAARIEHEQLTRSLVADRAWLHVLGPSSASLRQALSDYALAVRSMQSGGAARDQRLRAEAATAARRAVAALPCLILPQWRVPEFLAPQEGTFDLVVVEEASRSDVSAFPALLRGRQSLIVGDAMLTPPRRRAIDPSQAQELARRLLGDLPHGGEMLPGRSLFDLARAAAAGEPIVLGEEFRIDPAIVEFSNREFYAGRLVASRDSVTEERLVPPLLDVLAHRGVRKGDVNDAEAQAIARGIEEMLGNPALAGHSIGVISLLGEAQARRLDEAIRARIRPRDLMARRIVVGTPARFVGRGRSIIVLSMGISPDAPGIGDRSDVAREFNVAVTSARDRLVLFRSVEEGDVPPESCHARLIRHFREPFPATGNGDAPTRERCRTDLERAIFDALTERQFRVRPGVDFGRLRIDLVVEGEGGRRLAIECDGDDGEPPDQWPVHAARQRTLEASGWPVWRCFAASFFLRREHVLANLLGALELLGIDAQRNEPRGPEPLTEHTAVGRPRRPPAEPAESPEEPPAAVAAAPQARPSRRARPSR